MTDTDRSDKKPGRRMMVRGGTSIYTYSTLIGLVVIALAFHFLTGGVLISPRNIVNLMRQISINGILAVGMTMLLISGNIDLSVGSGVALITVASSIPQVWYNWGAVPSVALALCIGLAIGLWQGFWVVRGKIPAFIVTLAGMSVYRGVALLWTNGQGIAPTKPSFNVIAQGYLPSANTLILLVVLFLLWYVSVFVKRRGRKRYGFSPDAVLKIAIMTVVIIAIFAVVYYISRAYEGLPAPGLILAAVAAVGIFMTMKTAFGRAIYAIGGNREAARLSGINVDKVLFLNFVIMGVLTAIAGIVLTARLQSGAGVLGVGLELDAIAACIIGGTSLAGGSGTIAGSVVGAAIIGVIDNGMSLMGLSSFYKMIVKGMVVLLAVYGDLFMKRKQTGE
jgi:D-xylose transport system permease protein